MKRTKQFFLVFCLAFGWWGVLFPQLAMTKDVYRIVSEDGTVTGALRLQDGSGAEFTTEIETKTAYVYTPPTVDPEPTPDDPSSGGSASDDKPASDTSDTSKPADNPDTGSALPVAGAVAAILALGAVIVLRKKAE